jgi:hypothetical protein
MKQMVGVAWLMLCVEDVAQNSISNHYLTRLDISFKEA